jgi:PTS system glucose-specific IIC component
MNFLKQSFGLLQKIGKSLMLPVSVLPVAGILLGVGAAKFSFTPLIVSQLMETSGGAIFSSLPLIFAIGVALGLTKNDGVSALAATVGYFVLINTTGICAAAMGHETSLVMGVKTLKTGVFGGILVGIIAATIFNKYYRISLPPYLGFFAGKRFVPIATSFAAIVAGIALSFIWPPIGEIIKSMSLWAANESPIIAFTTYGAVERALVPFGLHHIWNVPFFFEIGSYINPETGKEITGEIARYLQGDPNAGNMAGGYLFKMWGLPAAAIAIWHSAKPENKKKIAGIMISAALTSFLTGITEPIEFAFLFVAPVLYGFHAFLSGLAFALCIFLEVKHGTTFSHGLIDYIVLYPQSSNAYLLLILGPIWGLLYYGSFRFIIQRFNLKTPGRTDDDVEKQETLPESEKISNLFKGFGGKENIKTLDACITRLRVEVIDEKLIDKSLLTRIGATGVLTIGQNIQAIFGTQSENLKTEMEQFISAKGIKKAKPEHSTASRNQEIPSRLLEILGGEDNILEYSYIASSRLRVKTKRTIELNKYADGDLFVAHLKLDENILHILFKI